jgi:thymidylate kinase
MKNKVVYITGPDGIGKTTYLKSIEDKLIAGEKSTRHIWIRSPKIISKPLMAYCRFIGLTKYKKIDGITYGAHLFYKSKIVSFIFPILQLIDFKIKWFLAKWSIKPDDVVLFDRFSLDTLADLMVDTRKYQMHKNWVGRAFLKMLPENVDIIILHVNEEVIRSRKLDTLHDDHLALKIKVYQILSKDLNLKVIDNNRPIEVVKPELLNYFLHE